MDPNVLDIISAIDRRGLNILLGGSKPKFTTTGKQIPHVFHPVFDPQDDDLSPLWNKGIKPLFKAPENSLIPLIPQGEANLFLACPYDFYFGLFTGQDSLCTTLVFWLPASYFLLLYIRPLSGLKFLYCWQE